MWHIGALTFDDGCPTSSDIYGAIDNLYQKSAHFQDYTKSYAVCY